MINFYHVLEVSRTASKADIKNAYLKLARLWHPDMNVGNEEQAAKKFTEVAEAYAVLSDQTKRQLYERSGLRWPPDQEDTPPQRGGVSFTMPSFGARLAAAYECQKARSSTERKQSHMQNHMQSHVPGQGRKEPPHFDVGKNLKRVIEIYDDDTQTVSHYENGKLLYKTVTPVMRKRKSL